ncbi:VCBS domain-containing protein, partial [Pseudomonas auratipiscis]|uniref:VCBS domain-containing protein n=1 Tax=Pseudomonas auratipiscis TaxID=3115853 RepID=UPI0038B4656E
MANRNGDVLTVGQQGADRIASGPITPQTIEGTYGKLVLAADGSYTYTLNSSDPDFINLHGGGSLLSWQKEPKPCVPAFGPTLRSGSPRSGIAPVGTAPKGRPGPTVLA